MKVSFIIPVYKVEKYLDQCVDSIISQSYSDFEILLIDDGSPDNCPEKCDEWGKRDTRIKVFHKENGGLSDARNYGLKRAQGEYIAFVDSDDYWENKYCLCDLIDELNLNKDIDVLCYNFSKLFDDQKGLKKEPSYSAYVLSSKDKNRCLFGLAKQGIFPISACTKLIRRSFLLDNQLFFISGLISEDIPWYIDLMSKAHSCKYINKYVYVYRQNVAGSITNKFSEKKFFDRIGIIESESKLVEKRGLSKEGIKALYFFLAYEFTQFVADINHFEGEKKNRVLKTLKQYQWLLKYDLNYKVRIPYYLNAVIGLENMAKLVNIYNLVRR